LLIYLGEPQQALDEIHRAMRVDPFCPDVLFEDEGMGYYWLENYGNAIKSLRKVKVPTRNSLFYLAAALAKAEQTETASDTLKQAITTMDMTVEGFVSSQGYKNQVKRDELLQTLEPIAV
jgi:tetratricopeptide (TPR) repeat protein